MTANGNPNLMESKDLVREATPTGQPDDVNFIKRRPQDILSYSVCSNESADDS